MLAVKSQDAVSEEIPLDLVKSIWQEIRGQLELKKAQIYEEIKNYPPPIPACDVQFNYLIEERARISQELSRLEALTQENLRPGDHLQLIDAFITSSPDLNDAAVQKIRSLSKGV